MGSPVIPRVVSVGPQEDCPKEGHQLNRKPALESLAVKDGVGQGGMGLGRSQGQLPGEVRRAVPPPAAGESGVVRQVFQGRSKASEELGQGQECPRWYLWPWAATPLVGPLFPHL